jgi:mannose/cellobiose epimerase-like protein (N-acyl-D-glucosamine 2-epimerase family)
MAGGTIMGRLFATFLLGLLACSAELSGAASQSEEFQLLERMLKEDIVPFWYPDMTDRESGGFRLNHGKDGEWKGPAPKGIVSQARMVWFLARLSRSPYGSPEHLAAAMHGFEFLRLSLWDQESGGFFWAVSHDGKTPMQPAKHLYGQAFGLYALSELAAASGEEAPLRLAKELFALLEEHAHDDRWGGYREFFERDWSEPPTGTVGYMGVTSDIKLMNTHLHLMEAVTTFYRVRRDPLVRERLVELMNIQSNSVVRKSIGACTDKYTLDWNPLSGEKFSVVSYGHDIENAWLLMDACDSLGMPKQPFLDLYRTMFDYSLSYGFDHQKGGFFYTGPFNAKAIDLKKHWWVQAEGLISALMLFQMTREPRYQEAFRKTLDWIDQYQTDRKAGGWYGAIHPDGRAEGDKANIWKTPYHNGRAVLECLKILRAGFASDQVE